MFLWKRRHSHVLDGSHSNFVWKVFLLFLSWCNKYNCWQIFTGMSKHMERMNQSLSTTVKMKTGTDAFASNLVERYTRNIRLISYSCLEQQRIWVYRNNSTQIDKKGRFKHYLDRNLKWVVIKTILNDVAYLSRKTHILEMRKEKHLPYWLTLLKERSQY